MSLKPRQPPYDKQQLYQNLQLSPKNSNIDGQKDSERNQSLQKQFLKNIQQRKVSFSFNERNCSPWNRKRGASIEKREKSGQVVETETFLLDLHQQAMGQSVEGFQNLGEIQLNLSQTQTSDKLSQESKMCQFLEKIKLSKRKKKEEEVVWRQQHSKSRSCEVSKGYVSSELYPTKKSLNAKKNPARLLINLSEKEIEDHLILNQKEEELRNNKISNSPERTAKNFKLWPQTQSANKTSYHGQGPPQQQYIGRIKLKNLNAEVKDLPADKSPNQKGSSAFNFTNRFQLHSVAEHSSSIAGLTFEEYAAIVKSNTKFQKLLDSPESKPKFKLVVQPKRKKIASHSKTEPANNQLEGEKDLNDELASAQKSVRDLLNPQMLTSFAPSYCTTTAHSAIKNLKLKQKRSFKVKESEEVQTRQKEHEIEKQIYKQNKQNYLYQTFFKSKRWSNNPNITKTLKVYNQRNFQQNLKTITEERTRISASKNNSIVRQFSGEE